jgi:hypothetical protein
VSGLYVILGDQVHTSASSEISSHPIAIILSIPMCASCAEHRYKCVSVMSLNVQSAVLRSL